MTNNNFETMEEILTPSIFCENQANNYIKITNSDYRKKKGQFFTPPKIAKFMAEISYERGSQTLKILDPGAGAGILTCAICELMASKDNIKVIEVDAYENDTNLVNYLQESFNFCQQWLNRFNIKFYYKIIEKDFILDAIEKFRTNKFSTYDIIIGNPPYFKISKNNPQAQEAIEFVYGQPNIYSLFMGVAVNLLNDDGQMVFITPRSYTTGPYFKAFRKIFFGKMKPERVHIFESRRDTFHKDSVLQENIILKARKSNNSKNIEISLSTGINDIEKSPIHLAPLNHVLFQRNGDILFRLPVDDQDDSILIKVDEWTGSLQKFGMKISTGPVVPFRTTEFLSSSNIENYDQLAPLLWMTNVYAMKLLWPKNGNNGNGKPQFIIENTQTCKRKLLVKDSNYVLLHRFSAKEQHRRLTAAPLLKGKLKSEKIGIENHLNYIYRSDGTLTDTETLGLAAIFNSSLLDRYFRISNGNTQVSATEIRAMPLPSLTDITEIGESLVKISHTPTLEELDKMVWSKV